MFCNLGASTQSSWIRPIMFYLWMIGLEMRFFPVGPTFENYPQVFSQKKVQPLGFYFWPLRLSLLKSLFWLVKLNMCGCTHFARINIISAKKHVFCILGARLIQNSWICTITCYLWMIGLVMGPTFENHPQEFGQTKVQPLEFYFWHLRLRLLKWPFLVREAEHI